MFTKQEIRNIKEFCAQINEIVVPEEMDLVECTALEEINKFLCEQPLTGHDRLIIGRPYNSVLIQKLCEEGQLRIHTVEQAKDGFEIKKIGHDIIVAGANPRGVLYGIYALEEWIMNRGTGDLEQFCVPYFDKRSDGLGMYHNKKTFNFGNEFIDDKKAEYLARLRVNQFCACLDGSPYGSHLTEFVHSDVFPFQKEPSHEAMLRLKIASESLAKYGIDFYLMLWEPMIPSLYAPLEKYPKDALGTVRRPWGGDENNLDATFCINSPIVQAYYRNLVHKFIKEYPYVRGFFFYNTDGSAWICTPELCHRCNEALVDSDPSTYNPWESQAKFASLLAEAAHEQDPSFKFNFWAGFNMERNAIPKVVEAAVGCDAVTTTAVGSDHDMYIPCKNAPPKPVQDVLDGAKKRNVSAYIYYAYNKLEAIQVGFPNPFVVADSIQTFKRWGLKNLMEVTGPTPALNQINAFAMKQFQSEPEADVESWLTWLSEQQFGQDAGKWMYQVWEYTRDAFECWEGFIQSPLSGSQFMLRMGLLSNEGDGPVIIPSVLEEFESVFYDLYPSIEPWHRDNYRRYGTKECEERFVAMQGYLSKAVVAAKEAEKIAADDQYIGLCYYSGSFEGIERHTMKEYAKVNLASLEVSYSLCRQKTNLIKAVNLLSAMRDDPDADEVLLQKEYDMLLREELMIQKDFLVLLKRLSKERPCLPLTGMCESEIYRYMEFTEERIQRLEEYIDRNR